ncbi:TspO/MBR family protein [Pseudoroseicyclus sp. CXY001]|uniref:TspO/MBR family protein n=1 Tax=Pseudoroseicyclus sp. CXY001 TaxID=3242492 RepID=UPI003570C29B
MTPTLTHRIPPWASLLAFLVLVLGAGSLIGYATAPGSWYDALDKPAFTPPNWLFGPAWTFLYICIAIAGWRVWRSRPQSRRMKIWWAQLLLNWLWSPVFFVMHLLWPAMLVITLVWLCILAFIAASWRAGDRLNAGLFLPYLAWVSFASALNLGVAILN